MALKIKKIRGEMKKDKSKKGRFSTGPNAGDFKFKPPQILSRDVKDYTVLRVHGLISLGKPGLNAMEFSMLVDSQAKKPPKEAPYKVTLWFQGVAFTSEKPVTDEKKYLRVEYKTQANKILRIWVKRPSIDKCTIRMKCTCKDFRHRFEYELHKEDALVGRRHKAYIRKTKPWPVGYPQVNATHKVGFCKHIHSALFHLKQHQKITE